VWDSSHQRQKRKGVRFNFRNLLSNASKFTEQGTVTLTVGRDDENGVVRFDVTDTGIGIPADRREKIIEEFTQADESTTRN